MNRLILFLFGLLFGAFGLGAQARIDLPQLKALLVQDKKTVVLDVRTLDEWAEGHLPMARLLTLDRIDAQSAAEAIPAKDTPVVVYCRSGNRSAQAIRLLKELGYTKLWDFGAATNWKDGLVK